MRKIGSPIAVKILKIIVKAGQEISEVLNIKDMKTKNSGVKQYFTCNESLALLAKLTSDYQKADDESK